MEAGAPGPVTVLCNAKINLFLKVKGKRGDGFHDIETVFHSISLADTLTVTATGCGVSVTSDDRALPRDSSNLAVRAAMAILELTPAGAGVERTARGVAIHIAKRIPVGAGLGGGSADAAGTLVAVNRLFDLRLGGADLEAIAGKLGSDVKFMLRGGCAVGRGRGDDLESLRPLPDLPVVVVMPDVTVSTAWAYDSLRIGLTSRESRLSMLAEALGRGDITAFCGLLENDFESLVFEKFPVVRGIRDDLVRLGACGALMSGSGSSVYGLFTDLVGAKTAGEIFLARGLRSFVVGFAVRGVTAPK
jgi:4-diphosphocytidyl-2-C-methyl-D-erythritol kinase